MPMDMQHRRDTSHRCYVSDKLCFHLQARKAPILVDPLDRAIRSHWSPQLRKLVNIRLLTESIKWRLCTSLLNYGIQ
jgi:hypothetical protein